MDSERAAAFLGICCHEQLGSNISFESSLGSYLHILAYIGPYWAIFEHIGLVHIETYCGILGHIGPYWTILDNDTIHYCKNKNIKIFVYTMSCLDDWKHFKNLNHF